MSATVVIKNCSNAAAINNVYQGIALDYHSIYTRDLTAVVCVYPPT